MLGTVRDSGAPLVGRAEEQQRLTSLLDDVATRGQPLVLRGEPGIGKSRLLSETERAARERGMAVLAATGVQSEAHLPFAGLHQLLRPVRGRASELRKVQRDALDAAFGLTDEAAPEHFRIAMAAIRDGYPSALGEAGLPEHEVVGLDEVAAAALLDAAFPGLPVAARARVLRVAGGNPLTILELPAAVGGREDEQSVAGGLPLTDRLERAFADRVSRLPDATRLLLLVAALSDEDGLDEIPEASAIVAGTGSDLDAAGPAVEAGIVDADVRTIRFRHPLIRSAVVQSARVAERRDVHEALAQVLADHPDRRAWHRAALVSGEHKDIALELERAAERARRRGAIPVAVSAMRRAAELGEAPSRSRRLLAAAGHAVELGRLDVVVPLLREIHRLNLGESDRARVTWVEEVVLTRPLGAEHFTSLIAAAERAGAAGDHDLHVDLLWLVASRAWWVDPGPDVRQALIDASRRLGDANADDPRVFAIHAYADPLGHAPGVLARLSEAASAERVDTNAARFFGPAALVVGAFDLGTDFLAAAIDGLRTEGRLGHLPRLLTLHSGMAARLGDFDAAMARWAQRARIARLEAVPLPAALWAVTRQTTWRPRSERRTSSLCPAATLLLCPLTYQR